MNILERLGFKAPPPPVPIDRPSPPARIRPPQGRPSYDLALNTFNQLAQIRQDDNLTIFTQMRKLIPLLDRGIRTRVALIGCPKIEAKNPETQADIEQWLKGLHVNHMQQGFPLFLQTWLDHMFLYGRSHAEILYSARGDEIWGIQQLSTPTIYLRPREDHVSVELIQQQPYNQFKVLDPRVMLNAIHAVQGDDPYGKSLIASVPFVGEIYTAMVRALGNTWSRFGTPDYWLKIILGEGFDDPTGEQSEALKSIYAGALDQALRAKADGMSLPFVGVTGAGGDMDLGIIGAAGDTLSFSEPAGDMIDQMTAAIGLPSWMIGVSRSTTERLSTNEASMITELVESDQRAVEPELRYLISLRQSLKGGDQDWSLEWQSVSLLDAKEQAAADLAEAQAEKACWENLTAMWRVGLVNAYAVAREFVEGMEGLSDEEIDQARAQQGLQPLSELEPPTAPAPSSPFGQGGGTANPQHPAPPPLGVRSLTYGSDFAPVKNGRNHG